MTFKLWHLCLLVSVIAVGMGIYIARSETRECPFRFLRGKSPVTDGTYAFKANFAEFRKTLEEELFAEGFEIDDDDPQGFGRKWRSVKYKREQDFVILFQNMRYELPTDQKSPYSVIGRDIEGWVSLQVHLQTAGVRDAR